MQLLHFPQYRRLTPWATFAAVGKDQSGWAKSTSWKQFTPLTGAAQAGLDATGHGNITLGDKTDAGQTPIGVARGNSTAWWGGLGGELTMFDPFRFAFDAAYSAIDTDYRATDRAGWLLGLSAEYKTAYGVPTLKFWYTSGDDSNEMCIRDSKYTLIILDNEVTAMTGHQPSPALDPESDPRAAMAGLTPIDAAAVCRALGVQHVQVVKPTNLKKMEAAVREALDYDGLSVIVAREPCPLHHKRQSGKGAKVVFGVDQSLCDHCRLCIKEYGCPAFQPEGDTVVIDPTQCSGCAVCVQVCPQRAIKPVK